MQLITLLKRFRIANYLEVYKDFSGVVMNSLELQSLALEFTTASECKLAIYFLANLI